VRVPFDRKVRENLESLLDSQGLNFAMQDKAAKHLSHLDIQEMGCVKGRFRREEPPGQRSSNL
jgi:FixJ family two-component response regulator